MKIVEHARDAAWFCAARLCSALLFRVSLCQERGGSGSLRDSVLQFFPYGGSAVFRFAALFINLCGDALHAFLQAVHLRLALCPPLFDPFCHIQDKAFSCR